MNAPALQRAQDHLLASGLDAWLVYDFRASNPVLAPLLGERPHTTRRLFLLVPASGAPLLLAHAIEIGQVAHAGVPLRAYATHEELLTALREVLPRGSRVAMEYSPGGLLPAVSWVDAGTVELLRGLGCEPVSSADLLQAALAVWSVDAVDGHRQAAAAVAAAKDDAFAAIGEAVRQGQPLDEYEVQRRIAAQLEAGGFETDHPAIVGVNAHSADPHYAPSAATAAPIGPGDWVLIDLWARRPGDHNVYADITWVARVAAEVTPRQRRVFDSVRRARDVVIDEVAARWAAATPVAGWELDRLARDTIAATGFAEGLLHRTGHSLSPGPAVHGLGANLDDVESRDTRELLPGTGFTVEPGVYLEEFGVRLEVDVYVDPVAGPTVTTPGQEDVVLLLT